MVKVMWEASGNCNDLISRLRIIKFDDEFIFEAVNEETSSLWQRLAEAYQFLFNKKELVKCFITLEQEDIAKLVEVGRIAQQEDSKGRCTEDPIPLPRI